MGSCVCANSKIEITNLPHTVKGQRRHPSKENIQVVNQYQANPYVSANSFPMDHNREQYS